MRYIGPNPTRTTKPPSAVAAEFDSRLRVNFLLRDIAEYYQGISDIDERV